MQQMANCDFISANPPIFRNLGVQTSGSGTLRKAPMDFIFFLQLFEVDRMPKKKYIGNSPNFEGRLEMPDFQSAWSP